MWPFKSKANHAEGRDIGEAVADRMKLPELEKAVNNPPRTLRSLLPRDDFEKGYDRGMAETLARRKAEGADYERVNGASDRAREAEVKRFGPKGYQGDPGTDAAERRADRMSDATGSWKSDRTAQVAAWDKVESAGKSSRQAEGQSAKQSSRQSQAQ